MGEYRYKAFISYAHADAKFAAWLHHALESYRVPSRLKETVDAPASIPANLRPIFRDRDDLASAHDLSESIRTALEQSENLIVVCSPSAHGSRWMNLEIEAFQQLGRSDRIFCLIIDGEPDAKDTVEDCLPPALRTRVDASGTRTHGSTEPMAADVRQHADGRKRALIKIIAGLLDISLDDLLQREVQRRYRRMATIAAASLVASIITVGLAINATMARTESEQRRAQAEGLLGFMVGDLRTSLQPIGRLDLLQGVGQQAMAYFATVDIGTISERELLQQARVMSQLGEIYVDQLQYQDALNSFHRAYDLSVVMYEKDPEDGERLFNRAQAEFWIGFVTGMTGNLPDAASWLERYRESTLDLYAHDPSRLDWLQEVAYGHHNLAVVNKEAGNLEAALQGFLRVIEIYDDLIDRNPSSQERRDRADAFSWIGDILVIQGDLLGALDYTTRSARDLRSIYANDRNNAIAVNDLAFALMRLAETMAMSGDHEGALQVVEEADDLFGRLVQLDTENLRWRKGGIRTSVKKAEIMVSLGQRSGVSYLGQQAVASLEAMLTAAAEDHQLHHQLAEAHRLTGWLHHHAGEAEPAMAAINQGIASLQSVAVVTALNDERLGLLASLLILQGDIHQAVGRSDQAEVSWAKGAELLETKVAGSASPYLLDPWSRLLIRTGQRAKGEAIGNQLAADGYHPLLLGSG